MKVLNALLLSCLCLGAASGAQAKVTAEEAAKLGTTLTPIGAEKAGNKDGSIPAWDGGLPQGDMPRGANPFSADKPLYTVTAQNYKTYADKLAEGYKALFQTFPDYKTSSTRSSFLNN